MIELNITPSDTGLYDVVCVGSVAVTDSVVCVVGSSGSCALVVGCELMLRELVVDSLKKILSQ